jgi:hypothetical protein
MGTIILVAVEWRTSRHITYKPRLVISPHRLFSPSTFDRLPCLNCSAYVTKFYVGSLKFSKVYARLVGCTIERVRGSEGVLKFSEVCAII